MYSTWERQEHAVITFTECYNQVKRMKCLLTLSSSFVCAWVVLREEQALFMRTKSWETYKGYEIWSN